MRRIMLKSKLHRATITGSDLHYEGSIAIGPELMAAADLREYEKVLIANVENGNRFETYVIRGTPGQMLLNGAAARLGMQGDRIIVMAFAVVEDRELADFRPAVVHLDAENRILAPDA